MARVRMPVVAEALDPTQVLRDKFPANGATIKFYEPGTASVVGTTTTGTPLSTSLYSGPSGGLPVSTTQTADTTGTVIVWAERPTAVGEELTCDIGVEYTAPTGAVAAVRVRERFETDPDDLVWVDDLPIFNASRPNLIGGTWYAPVVESTTSGDATTNRTRLTALFAAVGGRGGGVIRLPRNATGKYWHFDAGVVLDTGNAVETTVHLVGDGPRATKIKLVGSTGTFFSLQPTTSADLVRPYLMNFAVYHDSACTSGQDFLLNTDCADARFVDVEWWPTVGTIGLAETDGDGAFTCINTKNNLHIVHCRVSSRTNGTPTTINITHTNNAAYELVITGRTIISTALAKAPTSGAKLYPGGGTNIGINATAPGAMDLIELNDVRISGGNKSIQNEGSCFVYQLRVDNVQGDVANYFLYSVPSAGGGIGTTQIRNSWIHGDLQTIVLSPNSPPVASHDYLIVHGVESNGAFEHFINANSVDIVQAMNNKIQMYTRPSGITEPSGAVGILISGTATAEVVDNYILADATLAPNARAGVEFGATMAHIEFKGNLFNMPSAVKPYIIEANRIESNWVIGPNSVYDAAIGAMGTPRTAEPLRSGLIAELMTTHSTSVVLWIPSWADTTTSTTAESAAGRTLTHGGDNLRSSGRQWPLGNDLIGVSYATNQYSVISDAADLSFGTGGVTIAVLANVTNLGTARTLVSKADTGAEEYWLYVDANDKLVWRVVDQTAVAHITQTSDAVVGMGKPHLWVATRASAGTTSADLVLYEDGAVKASTGSNSGVFVQLRDTAANLEFGANNNHTQFFLTGRIYYVQMIPAALTALQVHTLTHRLNGYFGLGL